MLAGVCSIGFVSLMMNSVPEEVDRPFTELVLPLARAGFVPHHLAELVGWKTPTFFYVVAGCAVLASLLPSFWPFEETRRLTALRALTVAVAFTLGLRPVVVDTNHDHPSPGLERLAWFTHEWEPAGRDSVARLRARADKTGATDPCVYRALAEVERSVALFDDANKDDARVPPGRCH